MINAILGGAHISKVRTLAVPTPWRTFFYDKNLFMWPIPDRFAISEMKLQPGMLKNSSVQGILGILLQSAIKQELLLFYSITSDLDKIKTQIEFHSKA